VDAATTPVAPTVDTVTEATAPVAVAVSGTVDAATSTVDTTTQAAPVAASAADTVVSLGGDTTAIAAPVLGAPIAELPVHTIPGVQPVDAMGGLPETDTWTTQATGPSPVFDAGDLLNIDPAEQRILIAAGIIAVTGVVFGPAGVDGFREACATNARVMFTNVRLLPCYAEETVRRYAAAATEAVTRPVGRSSTAAATTTSSPSMSSIAGEAFEQIKKGFERATGSTPSNGGAAEDGRVLMQLGVVLGLVYAAFLTLWFWATRLRWRPRI
jgi:hypothetical protein